MGNFVDVIHSEEKLAAITRATPSTPTSRKVDLLSIINFLLTDACAESEVIGALNHSSRLH